MSDPATVIRFPQWDRPTILDSIESRIDSALSSSNSILNFALAPVRGFVHDVLHPVVWFADRVIGVVWDALKWTFGGLQNLTWDAINVVHLVIDDVVNVASTLIGNALHLAEHLIDDARSAAAAALGDAESFLRGLIDDVATYTTALVRNVAAAASSALDDATSFLTAAIDDTRTYVGSLVDDITGAVQALVDDASTFLRGLIDDVATYAGRLIDDLRQWADDAIRFAERVADDALTGLYRDVILPIERKLESFLSNEWAWAFDLLHFVEHVAGWLGWLDRRVVGDARDLWHAVQGWASDDLDELVAHGAGAFHAVA